MRGIKVSGEPLISSGKPTDIKFIRDRLLDDNSGRITGASLLEIEIRLACILTQTFSITSNVSGLSMAFRYAFYL